MEIERDEIDTDQLTLEQAEAMLSEARADLAAGRVVSHERVVDWLTRRVRGEPLPLPSFEADRVA